MTPMTASNPITSTSVDAHPPTPPKSPPLRMARTITELMSIRAKQYPDEPIFGYPSDDLQYLEYTYADLDNISAQAAQQYSQHLPVRRSSDEKAAVVALLGPSNVDYFFTLLALSRLGFTVLFLSTRISEAAYLSLLNATACNLMVVDQSFQKMARVLSSTKHDLRTIDIIPNDQYIGSPIQDELPLLNLDKETSKVAWVIHSSGSTGLPKPIYQTHSAALGNYGVSLNMRGFVTLPLFHAFGLSNVFRGITAVKKIYIYNARLPLTSKFLLKILHDHQFEIFLAVPYALKLLSETEQGITALAALKVVLFGGSACPDALGDLLTAGGVHVISHYGTTETGQLMTSVRPDGDKAWNYLREHPRLKPFLRMEPRGGNLFELCVLDGWPSKVATNRDDGSYATKDLFEPHPSITGAWKYCGRLDDTIVLINGEKAVPVAMEQALRQHSLVREAVVFGSGKDQVGVILVASELADAIPTLDFIEAIWPTIEVQNELLPAYAQLTKDMVRVLPAETSFPSTDKGSLMRQAFYRSFHREIEEVYQKAETNSPGTLVLSEQELRSFLRGEVLQICPVDDSMALSDETDLFSLGVDSLQATRLRSKILRRIQLNGNPLPPNVVFDHPTIANLAIAIHNISQDKTFEAADVSKKMEDLIEKYSEFPQHVSVPRHSKTNCVVVTGATGSLGAHVVSQLVLRRDVDEVCCLVRAVSNSSASERVIQSLKDRAVYATLSPNAVRKITCYSSDFSGPKLGLDEELYHSMSYKIICLVHCAWSVNFNKSLSSFESDCIAGARNLMLLCLVAVQPTPAAFNFCSSVSTVVNTPSNVIPEELPESLNCAQRMGYAQSKLVTEYIVQRAVSQTGMQARVLRIGQIIADTRYGIWNDTEAIPLMLQSATTIGALPTLDENARWLPVDNVATIVVDVSLSGTTRAVFNVVNPQTFHWTKSLLPALRQSGLKFEEVNQRVWIQRLRASNPDPFINPTIKLVEFFATKYNNDVEKRKDPDYVTTNAEKESPLLGEIPALSVELVKKFVVHFMSMRWVPH